MIVTATSERLDQVENRKRFGKIFITCYSFGELRFNIILESKISIINCVILYLLLIESSLPILL